MHPIRYASDRFIESPSEGHLSQEPSLQKQQNGLYDAITTLLTSTEVFEDVRAFRGSTFSSLTSGFAEDSLRYHGGLLTAGGTGGLILAEGSLGGSGSGTVASDRPR